MNNWRTTCFQKNVGFFSLCNWKNIFCNLYITVHCCIFRYSSYLCSKYSFLLENICFKLDKNVARLSILGSLLISYECFSLLIARAHSTVWVKEKKILFASLVSIASASVHSHESLCSYFFMSLLIFLYLNTDHVLSTAAVISGVRSYRVKPKWSSTTSLMHQHLFFSLFSSLLCFAILKALHVKLTFTIDRENIFTACSQAQVHFNSLRQQTWNFAQAGLGAGWLHPDFMPGSLSSLKRKLGSHGLRSEAGRKGHIREYTTPPPCAMFKQHKCLQPWHWVPSSLLLLDSTCLPSNCL